jgi:phosphoglycolate phosphatase
MCGKLVLWDWNGTLLDDVQYAVNVRNCVFPRFGLPRVEDIEAYHEQFTFPVRVYYERAGVTEQNFVTVANAWMDEYVAGCHTVALFPDALTALDQFTENGYAQVVLSASKLDTLRNQLGQAGILERFDAVLGLSHIYATDKTEIAKEYFAGNAIDPANCVMLGDTVHDALVADSLGISCALIARGHMSRKRLEQTGRPVYASLTEAVEAILGRKTEHP